MARASATGAADGDVRNSRNARGQSGGRHRQSIASTLDSPFTPSSGQQFEQMIVARAMISWSHGTPILNERMRMTVAGKYGRKRRNVQTTIMRKSKGM